MSGNENTVVNQPSEKAGLSKRMLIGAIIALSLIILMLSQVNEPKPEWGKFWMVRPLIIVPLAGAAGGLIYSLVTRQFSNGSTGRAIAMGIGMIIYVIGLWMGFVLGLDGTLWD